MFFIDNSPDRGRQSFTIRRFFFFFCRGSRWLPGAAPSRTGINSVPYRFLLFSRRCCSRLLRIVDRCDDFTDLHFLTFRNNRVEHAGGFSGDLSRNFVGLKREERIAAVHEIAGFLVPDGNDSAGNRFADCRNFYFDGHALLRTTNVVAALVSSAESNKQALGTSTSTTLKF